MKPEFITYHPSGSDIFVSGAEYLCDPVDAATGAQGKGLAKEFANRFPEACAAYKAMARRGQMGPGGIWLVEQRKLGSSKTTKILFVATKRHWREKSRIEYIANAVRSIRRKAIDTVAESIALPALGCGEGGLSWDEVRPLIEVEARLMASTGIRVMIYEPRR